MGTPFFNEFKKQASFFLREKIKHARLVLTDVTPAEFRLCKFYRKNWREFYNGLVLLEHLLTHGPESIADEFLCDREVIQTLEGFQLIDERGFDWGLAMRKKSERVLILLEKGPALKQERNRARKITRGIQGFGSMNCRWTQESKDEFGRASSDHYGRSNSQYECYGDQVDEILEGRNRSYSSDAGAVAFQKNKILEGEKSMKMNVAAEIYERVGEEEQIRGEDARSEDLEEFLVVKEAGKLKVQLQKEDHPFIFNNEHRRMESMQRDHHFFRLFLFSNVSALFLTGVRLNYWDLSFEFA
ncbi:hypothetical protein KSP40_PGU012588 [Platanthera guangdongensis]|uniref:ENTH domain-containing protein n=1 Tax=Platanthera guangdongensis TaxID=2320717 RepID=A0ABR2LUG6_9ASPA